VCKDENVGHHCEGCHVLNTTKAKVWGCLHV